MKKFIFLGLIIMTLTGCTNFYDIIITGGTVIDGSGEAGKKADVGIIADKIVAVRDLSGKEANVRIYATGKIVAPGFIDAHSHTDTKLMINPRGESKIRQGVTTEVTGNCGYSPFPQKSGDKSMWSSKNAYQDYASYCDSLEAGGMGINQASLVGQGNIRRYVMGNVDRKASDRELAEMKALLETQLKQGAWGMSTGLEYTPGSFTSTDELIELSKILAKHDVPYVSHMRNEDKFLVEATEEAIQIGRESGAQVQISHFKACNQAYWKNIHTAIDRVKAARKEGLNIWADRYPYNAYNTSLAVLLPTWAREGGDADIIARLKDPSLENKLKDYAETKFKNIGGEDKFLVSACKNPKYADKTIAQGMEMTGLSGWEYIKMVLLEDIHADMIGFAMDEDNLKKVLAQEFVMIGADASAYAPYGKLGEEKQHPRAYGSAARVLGKYAREEGLFSMETAVHKMSGLVAKTFDIPKRGLIKKGYYADIVIFDPQTVIDQATYAHPHQYPLGVETVLVNGKIVVKDGEHTGVLNGRALRKR
ncbi:MAG: D-aminoacylase [Candidatus Neomarinimicrobiota bacterium]